MARSISYLESSFLTAHAGSRGTKTLGTRVWLARSFRDRDVITGFHMTSLNARLS